jgi:hypothetical protein
LGETGDETGRARVKAGLWRGMQSGAILSLYVTVISIVGKGRVLRQLGAPLSAVITGYLVGGPWRGPSSPRSSLCGERGGAGS